MKVIIAVLLAKAMAQKAPEVAICSGTKSMYKDAACCGGRADMTSVCMSKTVEPAIATSPALPNMMQGEKPKVLLGYDLWSPYIYINELWEPTGFGPEFVKLMQEHESQACSKLDIVMTQDGWERMWSDTGMPGTSGNGAKLGDGITYGLYHAGMTYTHLKGIRPRMGEFSLAITGPDAQPSGLIVKLDKGVPRYSGTSDLNGATIVDVAGYAPTVDTFTQVQNWCNGGSPFSSNITFVAPSDQGNKAAMAVFKSRVDVDLMYVYADQAADCAGTGFTDDCEGWEGFGTEYAYLHIGLSPNINGTTIAFTKKNSGLLPLLNPCIQDVMESKGYRDLCAAPERPPQQMSNNLAKCFPNSFWTESDLAASGTGVWKKKQNERTDAQTCANGYCTCTE